MSIKTGVFGIVRLEELNVALIVKWIYRFANELDSKRVLSAKSGVNPNRILPIVSSSTKKSLLFNLISSLLDRNDSVRTFKQGFKMIIGNSLNADF